jgi:hypothetical protein
MGSGRLMEAGLAHAPAVVPELRLQSSRFLGRIGLQLVVFHLFVGNLVFFAEPRAKVYETAAIAAEGPIGRLW